METNHCPVCGHELVDPDLACPACHTRPARPKISWLPIIVMVAVWLALIVLSLVLQISDGRVSLMNAGE
jgi:hypothetical protein